MSKDNDITKEELQEWEKWAKEYEESKDVKKEEYGAGEEGTEELTKNYINATPGQTLDNEHINR